MEKLDTCLILFDLDQSFTENDLKNTYQTLRKVWDPDRFEGNGELQGRAEERMKEIHSGYQYLKKYLKTKSTSKSGQKVSYTTNIYQYDPITGQKYKKHNFSREDLNKDSH